MQTASLAPRPLDRLWLRLKPKAISLARRLSRKPAASAAKPRATLQQKLALRDKYGIKS
jgi:hypothetical protein